VLPELRGRYLPLAILGLTRKGVKEMLKEVRGVKVSGWLRLVIFLGLWVVFLNLLAGCGRETAARTPSQPLLKRALGWSLRLGFATRKGKVGFHWRYHHHY
jgi:F0F1-type ATP synthase membrane subunit a